VYPPLNELRVVPMNTAVAPAPSSLTELIIWSTFKAWWVKTQNPSNVCEEASIEEDGEDNIHASMKSVWGKGRGLISLPEAE
jgi:hypothetical protein